MFFDIVCHLNLTIKKMNKKKEKNISNWLYQAGMTVVAIVLVIAFLLWFVEFDF